MIQGKEHLNFNYYSKYLQKEKSIDLKESEKQLLEKYFRKELRILPEQKIDFDSPEILMIVDLIKFSHFLS
jgi:tRNA U54 and U55 pseudouridine synthase Pus10